MCFFNLVTNIFETAAGETPLFSINYIKFSVTQQSRDAEPSLV